MVQCQLYVHRNRKAYQVGEPSKTATSTFTQLHNTDDVMSLRQRHCCSISGCATVVFAATEEVSEAHDHTVHLTYWLVSLWHT